MTIDEQIDDVQRMLDEDPFDHELWDYLANLYSKAGDREKAIEATEYSLAIKPKDNMATRTKALQLLIGTDPKEIEEGCFLMEEFLKEHPEDIDAKMMLAIVYLSIDERMGAAELFNQIMADEDEDAFTEMVEIISCMDEPLEVCNSIINNYRIVKQWNNALNMLHRLQELFPTTYQFWMHEGAVLMDLERDREADECFAESYHCIDSKDLEERDRLTFFIAYEYCMAGRYREAERLVAPLSETYMPESLPVKACCALVLGQRGTYMRCLDLIEQGGNFSWARHVFQHHIPHNLSDQELVPFLRMIYGRCNNES